MAKCYYCRAGFIFISALLAAQSILLAVKAEQESSCWRHIQNVTFTECYVIIGDESLKHKFRQIRLLYNETTGQLGIRQTKVDVPNDRIRFDSADAGSDRESGCYGVRQETTFLTGKPTSTALDIKCKVNYTVVVWKEEGKHNVEASIFVDPASENVYWRSPKLPGEVFMTSIERKKSMVIFPDTKLWTTTTPFAIDSRRRLIFWVGFGSTSISYANLLASTGPIATVPTNADTVTFNSMTFDFNLNSIYWLVVVNRNHSVYRYNYTQETTAYVELVASFNVAEDTKISHVNFANSAFSFLAKAGKDYQVRLLPLPVPANSTSPKVVLQCIIDVKKDQKPRYIQDFNVFKDKPNWSGPSCKDLNCSDICLDGLKPQCVCPSAATTLTGRDSNTCRNITLGLVLESPEGPQLRIQQLPFNTTVAPTKFNLQRNVTSTITSDFTIYCDATFNPSITTSTIICKNIGSSGEKLFEKEIPGHNILKFSYQDKTDTFRWISEECNSGAPTSRWCVGNSTSKPKEDFVRHCSSETLENAVIDSSNEAVFWQSGNTIKTLFLNDSPISTKEIISTDSRVTILVEETYQTLILVKPNGNVTMVIYTDPEQFQTRSVHLNDGIQRVNFKYHCQRLYWIESPIEPTDNILFLKSYYFINSQLETVQKIANKTVDYYLKTDPQTDCGSIEIKPEKVPPPAAGPESSSTPHPLPPPPDFQIYIYIGAGIGGVVIIVFVVLVTIFMRSQSTKRLQERFVGILFSSPEEHLDLDENLNELKVALSKPFNQIIDRKVVVDENAVVGHGANTVVYRGHLGKESEQVAVKTVKVDIDDCSTALADVVRDLKVCAHVGNHSHILQFVGARVDKLGEGKIFAVFELSALGTLNRYLLGLPQTAEASKNVLSLMMGWSEQIAQGMQFLEEKGIPHGDLRTKNVYVFPNVVKLANFGLSGNISRYHKGNHVERSLLPWQWMAIESLQFNEFSLKSDVWSYAVTMWEIFSFGEVPYGGRSWNEEFTRDIRNGIKLNKPPMVPVQVYERIMFPCWQFSPDRRPNFASIVNNVNFKLD